MVSSDMEGVCAGLGRDDPLDVGDMSLGTMNPNDPLGSGNMDACNHDNRFSGIFDLPRDCHGCLACYAEKLAAEVRHLKQELANV